MITFAVGIGFRGALLEGGYDTTATACCLLWAMGAGDIRCGGVG